jgi:hypothetical protein
MFRRVFVGILLFALCGLGAGLYAAEPLKVAAQGKAPPPCCIAPAPAEPAVPDTRGTPEHPLVVDAIPVKTPTDVRHEDEDRAERGNADWWAKNLGIATILILLLQAIAFMIQAHRLNQSVIAMQEATQATKDVAAAETATVKMMDATARRELKAYLFIQLAKVELVRPGSRPVVKVTFCNFGKTPAHKIKLMMDCAVGHAFADLPQPQRMPDDIGTLGPTASFTATNDPPMSVLSDQEYQGLVNGTHSLFVYGSVRYEDTFRNKDRFQTFRLMLGGGLGLRNGDLALCKEGNETNEPD